MVVLGHQIHDVFIMIDGADVPPEDVKKIAVVPLEKEYGFREHKQGVPASDTLGDDPFLFVRRPIRCRWTRRRPRE